MYRNVEIGETDKVGSYEGQDKPEMQYLFMLHNFGDFGEWSNIIVKFQISIVNEIKNCICLQ